MNVKTVKQIMNLMKYIESKEILRYLSYLLNNLIQNKKLEDMEILNLFEYSFIKDEYHLTRDIIYLIEKAFNIKKYDIINQIRVNNGLGYDRTYLDYLLNDLNKKALKHDLFKNNRFEGLFNLLSDNNLIYNNIGLRMLIIKFLLNIDIKNLNVYILSNNRLNNDYKHLVYKGSKIKGYTQLYFINDNIILSTLQHDNIINVAYTLSDNINIFYGGKNDIIKKEDNTTTNDIKNNTYTYVDSNLKVLGFITDLINVLKVFKSDYKDININMSDINDNNINEYISILKKEYQIFYRYNKLYFKYEYIFKELKKNDKFKSNQLDNNTFIEDYDLYQQINLKDYFIKL